MYGRLRGQPSFLPAIGPCTVAHELRYLPSSTFISLSNQQLRLFRQQHKPGTNSETEGLAQLTFSLNANAEPSLGNAIAVLHHAQSSNNSLENQCLILPRVQAQRRTVSSSAHVVCSWFAMASPAAATTQPSSRVADIQASRFSLQQPLTSHQKPDMCAAYARLIRCFTSCMWRGGVVR